MAAIPERRAYAHGQGIASGVDSHRKCSGYQIAGRLLRTSVDRDPDLELENCARKHLSVRALECRAGSLALTWPPRIR